MFVIRWPIFLFALTSAAHVIQQRAPPAPTPCSTTGRVAEPSPRPPGCPSVSTTTSFVTISGSTCPAPSTVTLTNSGPCLPPSASGCVPGTQTATVVQTSISTTTAAVATITATVTATETTTAAAATTTATITETTQALGTVTATETTTAVGTITETTTATGTTTAIETTTSVTTSISTTAITATVTSISTVPAPLPSTCTQIIQNGGFENPVRDLFPWLGASNPGTGAGFQQDSAANPNVYFIVTVNPGAADPTLQLVQGITSCGAQYILSFRARRPLSAAAIAWTLRATYNTATPNTRTSITFTPQTAWQTFQLPALTLPSDGGRLELWLTAPESAAGTTLHIDDVELRRV